MAALNAYTNRDILKNALTIPTSTTAGHDQLDAVLEGVSRLIDEYVGFPFFPSSGSRFYTAPNSHEVCLDYPLTGVDSIQTASNGGSTFGTTLASGDYYLSPYNATANSPKHPWWDIELRPNSTASFPAKTRRAVKVTGTWGYYDERASATNMLSTGLDATATVMQITGASALHPGQTILIDSERMLVTRNGLSGSDTATTSGVVGIQRGVNGSVAATHASGALLGIYQYPVVERAALYQAEMDYRAKDAPLGMAGADAFGTQRVQAPGGLHPFTQRMLASFRKPVAF